MKTIISGSLAYDRIMEFPEPFSDHLLPDKLNEINVCFMVSGVTENFGGTAGNIAYALRLLGGEPEITASIGQDHQRYVDWLNINDITTARLQYINNEWTAGAYITTDTQGNQITNFNPGAMKHSSNLNFESLGSDPLLIISPGNLDDMVNYPALCRQKKIDYIFDPGQAMPMLTDTDLLNCIDSCMLLMVNDYEMGLILNKTQLKKEEILERAGLTIITMGEAGSRLYVDLKCTSIPVVQANSVTDPTGAGDAYRGGLLRGLGLKKSLEDSCLLGSNCASFAVECQGTQAYTFTPEEFERRLSSL